MLQKLVDISDLTKFPGKRNCNLLFPMLSWFLIKAATGWVRRTFSPCLPPSPLAGSSRKKGAKTMLLSRYTAEQALEEAGRSNPGPWVSHSRYVAQACQNIAARCPQLDADEAYIYGILHDIGRHAGAPPSGISSTATATAWPGAGSRPPRSAFPTPSW